MADLVVMEAVEFFSHWFAYSEGVIELRSIGGKRPRRNMVVAGKQMETFLLRAHAAGEDIYYGVATRQKGATGGKKEDCLEAVGAHLDHDCKDDSVENVTSRLKALPLPPSAIVASGNGLHAYWRFAEPVDLTVEGAITEVELLNGAIARATGGDVVAVDVSRILRPPGTNNFKGKTPKRVRLIEATWRDYDVAELVESFAEIAPPVAEVRANPDNPFEAYGDNVLPLDIERLWGAMKDGNVHNTQVRIAMSMLNRGDPRDEIIRHIVAQTFALMGDAKGWDYDSEVKLVTRLVDDGIRKIRAEQDRVPASSDDWPEPIDLWGKRDLQGAPALSPQMVPQCLVDYAGGEAVRLGVDPVAVATVALTTAAAATHGAFRIQPNPADHTFLQPALLWCLQIGSPGARKTPLNMAVTEPLRIVERRWREGYLSEKTQYDQDAERYKSMSRAERAEHEEPKAPIYRHLVVADATTEAMRDILADERASPMLKVLSLQDEIMALFGGFDAYKKAKGGDRGKWLKLYEGNPETISRQGSGTVYVENWSSCLIGNIQPERFREEASQLSVDGLLQRFIVVRIDEEARSKRNPQTGSRHQEQWNGIVDTLTTMRPRSDNFGTPDPIRGSDHLMDHLNWFDALVDHTRRREDPESLQAAVSKYTGLYARLCLVMQLLRCAADETTVQFNIEDQTADMAARYLSEVVYPNHLHIFIDDLDGDEIVDHARWIAELILAHDMPTITTREIGRAYRPMRGKPDQIDRIMEHLIDADWCVGTSRRGRSVTYKINPKTHVRFLEKKRQEKVRRKEWVDKLSPRPSTIASQTSPTDDKNI